MPGYEHAAVVIGWMAQNSVRPPDANEAPAGPEECGVQLFAGHPGREFRHRLVLRHRQGTVKGASPWVLARLAHQARRAALFVPGASARKSRYSVLVAAGR